MTKIRLVQMIDRAVVVSEFTGENAICAIEIRGFTLVKLNANPRQHAELQGAPVFAELCGPMWGGDAIRYEDWRANDLMSG